MTDLYSLNGAYPAPLPFRVKLSDGNTRTDPEQYSQDPAVMADIGAALAPAKPAYDPATQQLGWDGTNWAVEAMPPTVYDRTITRDTLLLEIRSDDQENIVEYLEDMPAVGPDRTKWKKARATYNRMMAMSVVDRDRLDENSPQPAVPVFTQLTNFFESEGLLSTGEALRLQTM